jgi:hypothetical protein
MAKSYITDHHGGGYQFQIAVPLDLRAFIGKKVFYHYIKRKPRREAEDEARKLAADWTMISFATSLRDTTQMTCPKHKL